MGRCGVQQHCGRGSFKGYDGIAARWDARNSLQPNIGSGGRHFAIWLDVAFRQFAGRANAFDGRSDLGDADGHGHGEFHCSGDGLE